MCGIFEDASKCLRCFLVSLRDEVRIDVEGRARVPMTESSGDRAHVNAGGKKACRNVVPVDHGVVRP